MFLFSFKLRGHKSRLIRSEVYGIRRLSGTFCRNFSSNLADATVEVHPQNFPFKFPANTIQIKTNEVYALAPGAVGLVVIKMH